jgi:hypothetical protein
MSGKSRNEGVRVIAQFRDRAIPLAKTPTAPTGEENPTKNPGEEVRPQDNSGTPNVPPPGEGDPTNP